MSNEELAKTARLLSQIETFEEVLAELPSIDALEHTVALLQTIENLHIQIIELREQAGL